MQQKNSYKKTPVISVVIASVCIVVYLAALVSAVFRIYISINERRVVAEQEFFDIADLASSAGVLGFMNEPFIETINDALARTRTLEALIISGPNGEYAFEKEWGRAVNWVNNSPRFKSRVDFSSQPLYMPLRIQGLRNVNIQAVSGALDYGLFTGILKQTLLMVLAALVLAFFTLLLESLLGKSAARPASFDTDESYRRGGRHSYRQRDFGIPNEDFNDDFEETRYREHLAAQDGPEPDVQRPVAERPAGQSPGAERPAGQGQAAQRPVVQKQAAPKPAAESFEIPQEPPPPAETRQPVKEEKAAENADRKTAAGKTREGPKGLYSPHGNIGWEEYTVDRLESELHRCASSEQDLVYVTMEFKDSSVLDESFYNQFAEEAVHFFTLRDLIFEKGERGITVIYPNIDLETGFAKVEEFHSRILSKYSGVFKSKTDLCIGLSSRAGRLIDAERIMLESGEALERALTDPVSHIVAFKTDPEKYRAFIASQNKKLP